MKEMAVLVILDFNDDKMKNIKICGFIDGNKFSDMIQQYFISKMRR